MQRHVKGLPQKKGGTEDRATRLRLLRTSSPHLTSQPSLLISHTTAILKPFASICIYFPAANPAHLRYGSVSDTVSEYRVTVYQIVRARKRRSRKNLSFSRHLERYLRPTSADDTLLLRVLFCICEAQIFFVCLFPVLVGVSASYHCFVSPARRSSYVRLVRRGGGGGCIAQPSFRLAWP